MLIQSLNHEMAMKSRQTIEGEIMAREMVQVALSARKHRQTIALATVAPGAVPVSKSTGVVETLWRSLRNSLSVVVGRRVPA